MIGVEILAAHEVAVTTFNWYVFVIGMAIVIGAISWLMWKYPINDDKITCILTGLLCLVIFACPMWIIASCTGEKVPDYVEYKVQLSDEVPIADFLATYEILGQEGQILSIREKGFE